MDTRIIIRRSRQLCKCIALWQTTLWHVVANGVPSGLSLNNLLLSSTPSSSSHMHAHRRRERSNDFSSSRFRASTKTSLALTRFASRRRISFVAKHTHKVACDIMHGVTVLAAVSHSRNCPRARTRRPPQPRDQENRRQRATRWANKSGAYKVFISPRPEL